MNSSAEVIFFFRGPFPQGSDAKRIRLLSKGLLFHGINNEIIIAFPPPIKLTSKEKRDNEYYALNENNDVTNQFNKIFYKISGTIKAYKRLTVHTPNLKVIIQSGLGFLEGILVLLFCKRNNVKFYAEMNDINRWEFTEKKLTFVEILAKYQLTLYEKLILKRVDVLFVVSSYLQKKVLLNNKSLLVKRITPAIINFEEYDQQKSHDITSIPVIEHQTFTNSSIKLLYAGSCMETNGIIFALDCVNEVLMKEYHEISIILVLSVGQISEIKQYVKNLSIQNRVHIYQNISYQYIPSLYQYIDILLLPEMGDTIAHAGFPSKTAEYLASGKAIIATEFSDLKDFLIHDYNALLSPIGDKATYKNNLSRAFSDVQLRKFLGNNGVQTAKQYFDYKQVSSIIADEIKKKDLHR